MSDSTSSASTSDESPIPTLNAVATFQHVLSLQLAEDELAYLVEHLTSTRHTQIRARQIKDSSLPPSVNKKIQVKQVTVLYGEEARKVTYSIEVDAGNAQEDVEIMWDTVESKDERTGGPIDNCFLTVTYKGRKGSFEASVFVDWRGGPGSINISHKDYRAVFLQIAEDLDLERAFIPPEKPSTTFLAFKELASRSRKKSKSSDSEEGERAQNEMLICLLGALLPNIVVKKELELYPDNLSIVPCILAELNLRDD